MKNRLLFSQMDKLCLIALAGILISTTVVYEMADGAVLREAEASDKPLAVTITAPSIDVTPLIEAVEASREALYWANVPLDLECQTALREACAANGVPVCLALGVIEVESGFDPGAVSCEGCVGLMQLNVKYFPGDLSPEDNIRSGVAYLGELLERYDNDTQAALTAYNAGRNTGDRTYARAVLDSSEKYGKG